MCVSLSGGHYAEAAAMMSLVCLLGIVQSVEASGNCCCSKLQFDDDKTCTLCATACEEKLWVTDRCWVQAWHTLRAWLS
jgi:hypothetical protein